MSDESVYYSPGEVDSNEATNEDSDVEVRKNLFAAFGDEQGDGPKKSKTERPEREPMKVYLRIRPFTPEEIKSKEDQSCLDYLDRKTILLRAPEDSFTFKSSIRGIAEQTHKFSFSKVYNDSTCQKSFFDDSMLGYVKDFIDGINCLVFTYGVTNSGKTFTIQGNPKNGGILPRTLDVLFNSIKEKQYDQINLKPTMYQDVSKLTKEQQKYEEALKNAIINAGQKENIDLSILWKMDTTNGSDASVISSASSTSTYQTANEPDYSSIAEELKERVCDGTVIDVKSQGPVKFCIWVSFAEIYNEYVYDLLDPTPTGKGKKRNILKLSGDKKGNPYIKGLKEVQVNSADEAFKVLRVGQKNQNIACTKLNQNSSRSHSIFTIKILRVVDVDDPHVVRISRLSFVDLAGSERYCKTQSTGDRLKEASNINTSIMTLGKCIEYLRYNQQHKNHPLIIPFRENKLTRLFQGFFLGKGKACMIVNVSKCASVFDETFNVLKFSAVAKEVTTKTTRNTDIFKPKQIPKPCLTAATPISNAEKSNWLHMGGLTTPRPIQREILNETISDESQQIQALIKSYEEIRKQLVQERRKNALMELKIREEVCAEMSEQIVEIERNYSERLQEEQQCLEEQCEKRIELLTKSMKKSRKRKKIDRIETEDDSYVSSVLLHAEKVKVKERDETILQLRAKLAEKEISHEFFKQTHTPEQQPKAITNLENQLAEAKETLKRQEEHIEDLQNAVNFAQDKVDEREMEVEKLKDMIESLEDNSGNSEMLLMKDLLEKTSKALDEARVKLDTRDKKIKERDERVRVLEEELANKKGPSSNDIEQFEKDLARLEEQTKISHQRNEFQADEIKQLRLENEQISSEKKAIANEIDGLKRQLTESEERREQLQFRDEEMKGKMKRYENVIKNHETALAESEGLIEQLNDNISGYTKEIAELKGRNFLSEDEDDDHDSAEKTKKDGNLVKEKMMVIQSLEVKLNDCKRRLEQMEEENEKLKELEENYCERVTKYEEMLEQKEDRFKFEKAKWEEEVGKLKDVNKDIVTFEEESRNLQDKIREYQDKLTDKDAEIAKLKSEVQDYIQKVEELGSVKDELESTKAEDQTVVEERSSFKSKQKEFEREIARLQNEVQTCVVGNKELGLLKEKLKTAEEVIEQYKNKLEAGERRYEEENEKEKQRNVAMIKKLEKMLEEASKALDKKNEQVIAKNKKMEKLVEEIEKMKELVAAGEEQVHKLEAKCFEYDIEKENDLGCIEEERQKNEAMTRELVEKDALVLKLRRELSNLGVELDEKFKELLEVKKELDGSQRKAEIEKLTMVTKHQEEIDVRNERITALQEEMIEFESKAKLGNLSTQQKYQEDIEEKKERMMALEEEFREFERKMEGDKVLMEQKYQEEVEAKNDEINNLRSEFIELERKAELEKVSTERDYKEEIEDRNKKIVILQDELKEFERKAELKKKLIRQDYEKEIDDKNKLIASLEDRIKSYKEEIDFLKEEIAKHNENTIDLKLEAATLKTRIQGLEESLANKNNELDKINEERNLIFEEKLNIEREFIKKNEMVSLLECKLELKTAENNLCQKQAKDQVKSAMTKASKKDNKLLEEVERTVKQHCDVIEMQKSRIMEQNQELEELRQQKDRVEQVEQDLLKNKQLFQDLRCSSMEKENQLQLMKKKHDEKDTELTSLQKKYDQKEAEVQSLKKEHHQIEAEFTSMQKRHDQKEAEFQSLQKRYDERETEFQSIQKKLDQREAELQSMWKEHSKKEAQLQSLQKKHNESLEDLEQVKCECISLSDDRDAIKSMLREREEQIHKARIEVENLQDTVARLQRERDEAVKNGKMTSQDESSLKTTPCHSDEDMKGRRSSEIPIGKLKEIILSSNKKKFDDDSDAEVFSSAKLRRSRRTPSSSATKENSVSKVKNEMYIEEVCSSQKKKSKKQNKRGAGRAVLFDINEKTSDVLQADTPENIEVEKPKRRRKLLSKNTGMVGDSPQVIPPSPTHAADPVQAIVRRQLRSSSRR